MQLIPNLNLLFPLHWKAILIFINGYVTLEHWFAPNKKYTFEFFISIIIYKYLNHAKRKREKNNKSHYKTHGAHTFSSCFKHVNLLHVSYLPLDIWRERNTSLLWILISFRPLLPLALLEYG